MEDYNTICIDSPIRTVTMDAPPLWDSSLSNGAAGLYARMCLLYNSGIRDFKIKSLAARFGSTEYAVRKEAKELKAAGYLVIEQMRDSNGRLNGRRIWRLRPYANGVQGELANLSPRESKERWLAQSNANLEMAKDQVSPEKSKCDITVVERPTVNAKYGTTVSTVNANIAISGPTCENSDSATVSEHPTKPLCENREVGYDLGKCDLPNFMQPHAPDRPFGGESPGRERIRVIPVDPVGRRSSRPSVVPPININLNSSSDFSAPSCSDGLPSHDASCVGSNDVHRNNQDTKIEEDGLGFGLSGGSQGKSEGAERYGRHKQALEKCKSYQLTNCTLEEARGFYDEFEDMGGWKYSPYSDEQFWRCLPYIDLLFDSGSHDRHLWMEHRRRGMQRAFNLEPSKKYPSYWMADSWQVMRCGLERYCEIAEEAQSKGITFDQCINSFA